LSSQRAAVAVAVAVTAQPHPKHSNPTPSPSPPHKHTQLQQCAQNASALELARRLEAHPKISRVHYPGLPSHIDHHIAVKQMDGFGGVVSFEVRGFVGVGGRGGLCVWVGGSCGGMLFKVSIQAPA